MATPKDTIQRWAVMQIEKHRGSEIDSEKDLFPVLGAIGDAWLFDADDRRIVHRLPNQRPLWKENLSQVIRNLIKDGKLTPIGNRGGSKYAVR